MLERFLSLFAPVERGEGATALLLTLNVFLLLTAYYIIKPVREALILSGAGAEIKSYAGAAQALMFLFIVPLYSAFARRTNRVRLINGVTAFFAMNLIGFYVLGRAGVELGVVFFLWVGMFNLMLVAQFWALANDIYTEEQGRRLFAIIGIGSSLGAIAGARVAGVLFDQLGPYTLMLVAAGLLLSCMGLTYWIHRREPQSQEREGTIDQRGEADRISSGLRLVFQHRYLLFIAMLVLLSNLVNTTGEFILGKAVTNHANGAADAKSYIGEFYSGFYFWVNLTGAVLQMFFVSRVMKYIGIGRALFFLPVIAFGTYGFMAFLPMLHVISVAKIAENSTDYSLQNTVRRALFLRTSRDAKYHAQSAIESFFWRTGDAFSGLFVFIGTQLSFGVSQFAVVNAAFVLVWLIVAYAIYRMRRGHSTELQVPVAA